MKQNPNENTQYWKENNPMKTKIKSNEELLGYFNQQEIIKNILLFPVKPEQKNKLHKKNKAAENVSMKVKYKCTISPQD